MKAILVRFLPISIRRCGRPSAEISLACRCTELAQYFITVVVFTPASACTKIRQDAIQFTRIEIACLHIATRFEQIRIQEGSKEGRI